MVLVRLLSRLLLATCLILNGTGTASAALAMQFDHMSLPSDSQPAARPDAHVGEALRDQAMATDSPCAEVASDDCCAQEQCDDACMQVVAAVIPSVPFAMGPEPDAGLTERPTAARAPPVLPQPVRPPIA